MLRDQISWQLGCISLGLFLLSLGVNAQNAYVVNYNNNTVSICPISGSGLGTCTAMDAGGALNFPALMVPNPAGSLSFITNFDNYEGTTLTICPINSDGTFRTP